MVKQHYEKYLPVYRKISEVNGGKPVWIPTDSHTGWYVNEPTPEGTRGWENGYPQRSRPRVLPNDLSVDVERTAYTTISYAPDDAYTAKYYREEGDEIEWLDNSTERLPDYEDITAWALFVDIDIAKDYKQRPLPDEHREVLKKRLALWVDAFSSMAGGTEHVLSLDSGGGVYVFTPPTGLVPVADRYNGDELNYIFNEIGRRMRTVTGRLNDLICDQDTAPKELFSADKVQNKNRQFKTIGSVHKSLDAVVHPISPTDIQIEHKRVQDVSGRDVSEAMAWAESFTDETHRSCVGSIIEYLFQGQFTKRDDVDLEYVAGGSWEDILDTWVEEKLEQVAEWESARSRLDDVDDVKIHVEVTQDEEVAREAIRRVNNQKLKQYIIDFLGEDQAYDKRGSEEMDFFPFWRAQTTETGRSAFYDFYEGGARFTDKADGTSRDIVYWVALEMTYSDEYNETLIEHPGESLDADGYRKAVAELRRRGEPIPLLVTDVDGNTQLPPWDIQQVAVELGIVDELADDKRLSQKAWNETLEMLDEKGITHNRAYKQPLSQSEITPTPQTRREFGEQQAYRRLFNTKGYYEDEFESELSYRRFVGELSPLIHAFSYDGDEILGSNPKPVMGGVFDEQTDEQLHLSRFTPTIRETAEYIDSYEDVTIEVNVWLSKNDIQIYTVE